MNDLLTKMNFKGHSRVDLFNAPEDVLELFTSNQVGAEISINPSAFNTISFAVVFVMKQEEINHFVKLIAPKLDSDAVFWICYPKGSSKRYKCDFNRDKGWDILGEYEMEGIRQVAVNEDWSALRFRKVEYIKTLTRKFDALSEKGKEKAGQTK
jgi:hypothetical protein